jgi:crotonobetainyl-CoA:carnitine CoA-transferase CaiB-like acyl-CoA transferase
MSDPEEEIETSGWPEGGVTDGMLSGLKILDFTTFLPGPFCTQMFGDMGADVIKVEHPAGDPARGYAGGMYEIANRNKRAITLDLKRESDQRQALRLARHADVVLESFRPGVADRLGIGAEALRATNKGLVYCSISGFGQTSPWRDRPGHDLTYLAKSGALSFSPHWKGFPKRSGVPIADLSASSFAAVAILAALRDRDRSGVGCYLDVSLLDSTMAFIAPRGGPGLTLRDEDRLGVYANNDIYLAADGERVAVSAVEQHFWERLRDGLKDYAPGLLDPRFADGAGRVRHGDDLYDLLEAAFVQEPAEHWEGVFGRLDVPVERVTSLAEAARSEHAAMRELVAGPPEREQIIFPVRRDGAIIGRFRRPPPGLGMHNAEILDED